MMRRTLVGDEVRRAGPGMARAAASVLVAVASVASLAHAQRWAPPLTLPQVASQLEALGVTAPPVELAQAHRTYALAVVAAQATPPSRERPGDDMPGGRRTTDGLAVERAAAAVDTAERTLFASISALVGDAAPSVETARLWTRIERAASMGHDQTGTVRSLGSPFVPPVSASFPAEARMELMRALGTQVAALDRRQTEFARLYLEVEGLSWAEQGLERGVLLQRDLFNATMRVLEAQWNIEREIEARLPPEQAARLRDRFIHDRLDLFEATMFAQDGWVEPAAASPASMLIRLRQAGAVTAENEVRVRERLAALMKEERTLGTRLVETLIAPLRGWREGETRYERAKELAAPVKAELGAIRLAAAKDLAEIAQSPWLLDATMPQPRLDFKSKLSEEDEQVVGGWLRFGSYASGADQIAGFIASPVRLDPQGAAAWARLLGLEVEQEPLVAALLERAEEQWAREVAPELVAAAAIADPLVEELVVVERAMSDRDPLPTVADADIDRIVSGVRELGVRRAAAWTRAIAIVDAFADGLGELLEGHVTDSELALIRAVPRVALARTLVMRSNPYVLEAAGGVPIDPLAMLLELPFSSGHEPRFDGPLPERVQLDLSQRALVTAASARLAPIDAAARTIIADLSQMVELQLMNDAGWTIRSNEPGAMARAVERSDRRGALARAAMRAWREGEQRFIDGMAEELPAQAAGLRLRHEDLAFAFVTHPRRGLAKLRRELAEAQVDPGLAEAIVSIVEPDIDACIARCIAEARRPRRDEDSDPHGRPNDLMDRWRLLTQMIVPAQALAPTPAWVLSRTLPAETVARCPTLAGMRAPP